MQLPPPPPASSFRTMNARHRFLLAALLFLGAAAAAPAAIRTSWIDYTHGDTALRGYLAHPENATAPLPAVLVIHEWWGLNDNARQKTKELAEAGYVAFALDMYGAGVVTDDPTEAGQLAGQFYGQPLFAERARAGLDALLATGRADPARVAAIGFCFGGAGVQFLAYSGAPLAGIVSFHGNPIPPSAEAAQRTRARILILHGAADPLIPQAEIEAYFAAMNRTDLDWRFLAYGGAVHSFTNPGADRYGIPGVAYHERTHRRSWADLHAFLREIFE
jgi:dienelactone hydrolase